MARQLSLVPRFAAGASVQDIDDEVLAFDGVTLSRLTALSALVARHVDGTRGVSSIVRAIGAPADEVREALDELAALGVVELVDGVAGYRRPAHVGVAHDDYQIVLLDLRDGERRVLSPTGAAIWDAVMATGSLERAVAQLQDDFPDAPGLAADTERFVADLETQGLLERG